MSESNEYMKSVPRETFEQYAERFKDFFKLKRRNGIIEVRMHHNDAEANWSYGMHNGLGQVLRTVANDPENEVMILTGTGKQWLSQLDPKYLAFVLETAAAKPKEYMESIYDHWYVDGSSFVEAMVYTLNIPTIGVINGPGIHTEFPLLCDLTLCAEDAAFGDPHFSVGTAPGDGQLTVLQELVGQKAANFLIYMGKNLTAQEALEMRLVNEVLPREQLLPRAWEIAEHIMKQSRVVRRMSSEIIKRRWRRILEADFKPQFSMECFAAAVSGPPQKPDPKFFKWDK